MTFEGAELEALEKGRNTVVVELNSAFIAMAEQRLPAAHWGSRLRVKVLRSCS